MHDMRKIPEIVNDALNNFSSSKVKVSFLKNSMSLGLVVYEVVHADAYAHAAE